MLDHYSDAFDRAVPAATTEGKGQLETLLVNARRVLIKYPIAGAAGYRALMAEGRKFADTPEGREIQEMLTRSPVFLKARTLFEGMSGGMLRDEPSMLPSVILDAGMAELAHSEIERLLERLATMQPGK